MNAFFLLGVVIIGVAIAALAVVRPRVALLLLITLDISNLNGVIAEQAGISPYKPELALAVVVLLIILVRRRGHLAWSPVLLGVAILFAGFCVSLISTDDPITSQALLSSRGRDLFYFFVVYALLLATGEITRAAQGIVLVLAALAGLTVVHEFVLHNNGDLYGLSRVPLVQEGGAFTPRHAGTSSDVNFWARLLILVSPLALSLWSIATRRPQRLLWAGCALALLAGVYLTQSRGGFIALFVAVIGWMWFAGSRYRKSLLLAPVTVAVLVPLTGIASRLGTLSAITASSVASADVSVVTRKRLQLDALHMFLDSPITGHGIGSYVAIFHHYDRLSDYYQPVDIVVAAHNLYLEQAADGGVVLLLAWGVFVGSVLFCAIWARTLAARAGDLPTSRLALGVVAGLVGWLLASVFLHLSDFRALLVVAALAAALDVHARRLVLPPVPAATVVRAPSRPFQLTMAALAALSLAGLVLSLTTGRLVYRNEATLAVVPAATGPSGSAAYQLDVVSRGVVVPTLATVLDSSLSMSDLARFSGASTADALLTVGPSTLGGALLVTVTAPNRASANVLGTAAVALAKNRVDDLDTSYQLTGEMAGVRAVAPVRRWLALPFLVSLGAAGLILLRTVRRQRKVAPAQPYEKELVSVP
jgi:O-antigen ligase